ncbi:FimV/HubP family polar landmark protein [Acidithiobacillus sp.]|uniref:FimV/HubP family polar landmark protein n=1 Tax=Acidithiobacillus sp. TaxID=1872118 RepID=UPI00262B5DB5|nr:FimV/HubP family polar landmark protein [Acidithiobacillus sp.]MDD2749978.1 Motility protein FimV [Acidithiobacillus sp.]MDD5279661.1 Motility protein FimV [Acidithiobacillus sp.]
MERKNWLWAMAGMGLLMPGLAQALGLGSLQVLSAPGEPFRAEIPIQSVTPQTASSLNASLAPDSAFAMINLPQAPTLEHWQFTVRHGSQPAILISSPLPVSQPNLQFLVQLNWSGGQLVREYSASVANAAAAMPLASSPAPLVPSAIVPATKSVVLPPAPVRLYHGWSRVNRYGPVPVNSSLYDIARSITNSNGVTLDQVMSAVVKANPQAFKNANPTCLYAGSMLNLPNVNQVQAMTSAQAAAWLSTQSQAGSAAPLPAAQTSEAATSTAQPQKASTSPTESANHLVLSSAPANAVAASADTASATRSPLAADTLALQAENQKLKGEVTGLGQRLSAEERLLANQSVQLATLSRNSANSNLFNNIPLLISLGGNLLLLILFIWMLRRQKESEKRQSEVSQRLSTLNSPKSKPVAEPPFVAPAAAAAYQVGHEPVINPAVTSTPMPVATSPVPKEVPIEVAVPVNEQAPGQTSVEYHDDLMEIDPIEQADLYLTYGKSEQAITVMNEALDENPRRKELYVKLLDMYATLDRRSDYLDLAERMRGRFGPHNAAWQEVAAQGARLFPGNALFVAGDEAGVVEAVKPTPVEEPTKPVHEASAASHADVTDMLDFDFSHGQEKNASTAVADESFPADEKDRLLQDIDEQFRLMDADNLHAEQTADEVESASHEPITAPEAPKAEAPSAEDTLPFSFGLSPFEEEQAPAVPAKEPEPEPEVLREMPKPYIVDETSPAYEDWDAVGTKLDLAKAYIEMGDSESARDLLEEVSREGSSAQREEAQKILEDL